MACDPGLASVALAACGPGALAPLLACAAAVAGVAFAATWAPTRTAFRAADPIALHLRVPVRSLVVCTTATGLLAFLAGYYAAHAMRELVAFALLGAAIAQVLVWVPSPRGSADELPA